MLDVMRSRSPRELTLLPHQYFASPLLNKDLRTSLDLGAADDTTLAGTPQGKENEHSDEDDAVLDDGYDGDDLELMTVHFGWVVLVGCMCGDLME